MPRRRTIACAHCGYLQLKRDVICDQCGRMTRRERNRWIAKAVGVLAVLIGAGFVWRAVQSI